jgi:hypothetical protein
MTCTQVTPCTHALCLYEMLRDSAMGYEAVPLQQGVHLPRREGILAGRPCTPFAPVRSLRPGLHYEERKGLQRRVSLRARREDAEPASGTLAPCHAALPHLFGLSGGRSPGWRTNSPACGYPAVRGYLGEEVNIAFTATPPSPEPAPRWTPSTSGTAREYRYQPKDSGNTKIYIPKTVGSQELPNADWAAASLRSPGRRSPSGTSA